MPENNFIYQDHFILAEQQEVSHDTSLSGNGTVNSPLGVDYSTNGWIDIRSACQNNSALYDAGSWSIYYNPFLKLGWLSTDIHTTTKTGAQFTWPSYFKPIGNFSLGASLGFYVTPTIFNKATTASQWIGGSWVFGVE